MLLDNKEATHRALHNALHPPWLCTAVLSARLLPPTLSHCVSTTTTGSLQVLLSAKDLDGVLTATSAFFSRMCSLCTMQPRANTAAALASTSIAALMDVALTAAAAAGLLQEARHKLHGLKV